MVASLSRRVMETVLVFDDKAMDGPRKIHKEGLHRVHFLRTVRSSRVGIYGVSLKFDIFNLIEHDPQKSCSGCNTVRTEVYINTNTHTHTYIYIYIYTYIQVSNVID
jgi:hypothetical protein